MKRTGAFLTVYALEQIGVRFTLGMPGVHNVELYDELGKSEQIDPVLVTHEGGGAFMADAISRTSSQIGTLVIVPAAGTANAMPGIGEAFLDGIPMLIISGGIRRDTGKYYQLHAVNQERWLDGIIKRYYLIREHAAIIPTIYEAYETALEGEPGPVFVEIPAEIQMFEGEVETLLPYVPSLPPPPRPSAEDIQAAVELLSAAEHPGLYVGWGAVDAVSYTAQLAELLVAPVSTTLQGLSAFPANHPLHTGVGFGSASVPAAQKAFKQCDALLAVGVRFSELATGSYGLPVPENLVHVDIQPEVFHKNYPAKVAIHGDAAEVLRLLVEAFRERGYQSPRSLETLASMIKTEKEAYMQRWLREKQPDKVSPGWFFKHLRHYLEDDAIVAVDDGKHTFLTAELLPIYQPRGFISPSDFNCMGYCVPAAIGAKLVNPHRQVVGIVGDGAFLMSGLELLTASDHGLGVVLFVFHDGELGQISQFQKISLNRKVCTVLPSFDVAGIAQGVGAHFFAMRHDGEVESVIQEALEIARTGKPVLVDVNIDYSQKTFLTRGVVKVNLRRFPPREKARFVFRALKRHITG